MKHLYEINEASELYAADTREQALAFYKELTGEDAERIDQLPDNQNIPVTSGQLAALYDEPIHVITMYEESADAK